MLWVYTCSSGLEWGCFVACGCGIPVTCVVLRLRLTILGCLLVVLRLCLVLPAVIALCLLGCGLCVVVLLVAGFLAGNRDVLEAVQHNSYRGVPKIQDTYLDVLRGAFRCVLIDVQVTMY